MENISRKEKNQNQIGSKKGSSSEMKKLIKIFDIDLIFGLEEIGHLIDRLNELMEKFNEDQ